MIDLTYIVNRVLVYLICGIVGAILWQHHKK